MQTMQAQIKITKGSDGFYHYTVPSQGGDCYCKNRSRKEAGRHIKMQRHRARENAVETRPEIYTGLQQKTEGRVLGYLARQETSKTVLGKTVGASWPVISRVLDRLLVRGIIKKQAGHINGVKQDIYSLA